VSNTTPTTDLLQVDRNTFVAGEFVSDPSNQTTQQDLDQNRYTELEYALQITSDAVDQSYCFRVTDDGSPLDAYTQLPELSLSFAPVLGGVSLNNGQDIVLNIGTTTSVLATSTVEDLNGVGDLGNATTTFYTTSATADCTPDNNDCYIVTGPACTYSDCSGNTCLLTCEANIQFHANPTDDDGVGGEAWFAFMEVEDLGGEDDFASSMGVELLTMLALEVQNEIVYGAIEPTENTGTFNPNTDLINIGNGSIDVEISGTDMSDGFSSVIPTTQQRFATSTFDYTSCTSCNTLTTSGTNVEVDLDKPVTDSPPVLDEIYWGIEVPFGTASNPHTGFNTFSIIAD
jgi:hypothetical protein